MEAQYKNFCLKFAVDIILHPQYCWVYFYNYAYGKVSAAECKNALDYHAYLQSYKY